MIFEKNSASLYLAHLDKLNISVPRYTSYPTAADWGSIVYEEAQSAHKNLDPSLPVSLYVHIPFCHSMCLYCGCAVVLNRDPRKEERYVNALCQEIRLASGLYSTKLPVLQLHFGGGTPTKITVEQLQRIFDTLYNCFDILPEAEIAIEVDPRTIMDNNFHKLFSLKKMGFNRISFGVQDTNEAVQEAVKRRQTAHMTQECFFKAREIGFKSINIDLIYGLPLQNRASFRDTIYMVGEELKPERVALFSYAKVPWLKPHQKAIPDKLLPSVEEKFLMYMDARESLAQMGYTAIGMDHFACGADPLAERFKARSLRRNFQGYTVLDCKTMIGFGMSAISDLPHGYFQNAKTVEEYCRGIEECGILPIQRGKKIDRDDQIRREAIESLMCHFALDMRLLEEKWHIESTSYFASSFTMLEWFEENSYIHFDRQANTITVTSKGELFIRNIASCFDRYYQQLQVKDGRYSKAV